MAMDFWKIAISTKGRISSNGKFDEISTQSGFHKMECQCVFSWCKICCNGRLVWGVFGVLEWSKCCSLAEEQVAYTYSDVLAKLFHSMYLVSLRRRKNLMILEELRA